VDSKAMLRACGIVTPREGFATTVEDAVRAASQIGYPVAVKLVSRGIAHKSDIGGVELNIASDEELRAAFDRIQRAAASAGVTHQQEGVLVSQYISGGIELALGLHRDPEMGMVLMVGAGGVLMELISDTVFACTPVNEDKAKYLLQNTKVSGLLDGYRGKGPFDRASVLDAIAALDRFALQHGDRIDAVDINPLVVLPDGGGAVALDAVVSFRGDHL